MKQPYVIFYALTLWSIVPQPGCDQTSGPTSSTTALPSRPKVSPERIYVDLMEIVKCADRLEFEIAGDITETEGAKRLGPIVTTVSQLMAVLREELGRVDDMRVEPNPFGGALSGFYARLTVICTKPNKITRLSIRGDVYMSFP